MQSDKEVGFAAGPAVAADHHGEGESLSRLQHLLPGLLVRVRPGVRLRLLHLFLGGTSACVLTSNSTR